MHICLSVHSGGDSLMLDFLTVNRSLVVSMWPDPTKTQLDTQREQITNIVCATSFKMPPVTSQMMDGAFLSL